MGSSRALRASALDGAASGPKPLRALGGIVALPLMLGLAACSGGFFPAPIAMDPAPAESASAGPRAAFLAIGDLKWTREGKIVLHLHDDGTLEDQGIVLGKLGADGVFTAKGGSTSLVMAPDGSVHVGAGFDLRIDQDGTAITRVHGEPDESLTLAQASKPRGGKAPLVVEGATPLLRRTAMWILMIPDVLHIQAEEAR